MKIGISITSSFNTQDVRFGARQMIERTHAAASAGLDSLFVGDHHIEPVPYYQNTPILGRMLAEWTDQPAGALFLLPLWNPVLAAEQIATLACIAEGPFIMQCGLGRGEGQFKAMGADIRYRPSAFEQSLATMKALWRGEAVTLDGRWKIENARISPLPPESIEVWIGASAVPAIERAARLGDVWLASPSCTSQQAETDLACYTRALAKYGKSTPTTIAIRRDVYVAESQTDADEVRSMILAKGYRGFDPETLVIGTPDKVAEQFKALNKLGFTDIITRNLITDPQKAIASTERLAEVKALLL